MNLWILIACEFTYPTELLACLRRFKRSDQASGQTRQAAQRAYTLFTKNPDHPSLRFKKLGGYDHIWSVRINEQYRAVGERHGDTITWVWIGSHNEFDNLFG